MWSLQALLKCGPSNLESGNNNEKSGYIFTPCTSMGHFKKMGKGMKKQSRRTYTSGFDFFKEKNMERFGRLQEARWIPAPAETAALLLS